MAILEQALVPESQVPRRSLRPACLVVFGCWIRGAVRCGFEARV